MRKSQWSRRFQVSLASFSLRHRPPKGGTLNITPKISSILDKDQNFSRLSWPLLVIVFLVNDQKFGSRGENLKGFQELDQVVLVVRAQAYEVVLLVQCLAGMSYDCFAQRRQLAMMEERRLV